MSWPQVAAADVQEMEVHWGLDHATATSDALHSACRSGHFVPLDNIPPDIFPPKVLQPGRCRNILYRLLVATTPAINYAE